MKAENKIFTKSTQNSGKIRNIKGNLSTPMRGEMAGRWEKSSIYAGLQDFKSPCFVWKNKGKSGFNRHKIVTNLAV